MADFPRIKQILDDAIGGLPIGAHGAFWQGVTRDAFVALTVRGEDLIVERPDGTFDPDESALVKALEGRAPFGRDLTPRPPGARFRRMPAGRPPVSADRIQEIRDWISAGCPDVAVPEEDLIDESSGGPIDPVLHNAYFRDFDNWAMFSATPEVNAAINTFFAAADKWFAFAAGTAAEAEWQAKVDEPAANAAVLLLEERQRATIMTHYGTPVPLLTLIDGYERFGDSTLPLDPLRPVDPQHNMNGDFMWFMWSAFASACLRTPAVPNEFWRGVSRAILVGLMNDGLFRGRFPVVGFDVTPAGKIAVRNHVAALADADIEDELVRRFLDSGFA